MLRSDLFIKEVIEDNCKKLEEVKNCIISVACETKNAIDADSAIEHLYSIVKLGRNLEDLKDNLPFIEFKKELQ